MAIMTQANITPLYAALLALLFVGLGVRTVSLRRKLGVAVGHGDNPALHRAARAHANFAEYVPITLLMIFFVEINTGSTPWIHILCGLLVVGRLSHAYGVSQVEENYRYRVAGMALTFTAIICAALGIVLTYLQSAF